MSLISTVGEQSDGIDDTEDTEDTEEGCVHEFCNVCGVYDNIHTTQQLNIHKEMWKERFWDDWWEDWDKKNPQYPSRTNRKWLPNGKEDVRHIVIMMLFVKEKQLKRKQRHK